MKSLLLFPTTIGKFELGRELTDEEMSFVNFQPTYKNTGNTTSNNRAVLKENVLTEIEQFIQKSVAEYVQTTYVPRDDINLQITQSWLNYCKPGEYHHKHAHPNSLVSGVFYVKADKQNDKIMFYQDGYQQLQIIPSEWNVFNSRSWWIEVNTGDLLLFPSHLTHSVEPVQNERISLSFNTFPFGMIGDERDLTALKLN